MPVLKIVPAYNVDLKRRGTLLEASAAADAGYLVTSDNPVHRELLNKLFHKPAVA